MNQASYKELTVWHISLEFANSVIDLTETLDTDRKHYRLIEQLESSATSVPMNIAEGKERFSRKEFSHFLMIARGSLYETMTLLEIFALRKWITQEAFENIQDQADHIAKMLNTLNRTLNSQE